MDGGINAETAPLAVKAGANVLVAGSAVFNAASLLPEGGRNLQTLKAAIAAIKGLS